MSMRGHLEVSKRDTGIAHGALALHLQHGIFQNAA